MRSLALSVGCSSVCQRGSPSSYESRKALGMRTIRNRRGGVGVPPSYPQVLEGAGAGVGEMLRATGSPTGPRF